MLEADNFATENGKTIQSNLEMKGNFGILAFGAVAKVGQPQNPQFKVGARYSIIMTNNYTCGSTYIVYYLLLTKHLLLICALHTVIFVFDCSFSSFIPIFHTLLHMFCVVHYRHFIIIKIGSKTYCSICRVLKWKKKWLTILMKDLPHLAAGYHLAYIYLFALSLNW